MQSRLSSCTICMFHAGPDRNIHLFLSGISVLPLFSTDYIDTTRLLIVAYLAFLANMCCILISSILGISIQHIFTRKHMDCFIHHWWVAVVGLNYVFALSVYLVILEVLVLFAWTFSKSAYYVLFVITMPVMFTFIMLAIYMRSWVNLHCAHLSADRQTNPDWKDVHGNWRDRDVEW